MNIIMLATAAAIGVYALAGPASAACEIRASDNRNNTAAITFLDEDCPAVAGRAIPRLNQRRDLGHKSASRLAAEMKVARDLEGMLRANPPEGVSQSFLSRILAFLFGSPSHATMPDRRAQPVKKDKEAGAAGDVFCMVEVSSAGDRKDIGVTVAANRRLKAIGQARITVDDSSNVLSFASEVPLNLRAGKMQSFVIASTNLAHGAAIDAVVTLGRKDIVCN